MVLSNLGVEDRELYRWQLDALVSWLRCGRRGRDRGGHRLGQDRRRDRRRRPTRCAGAASCSSSSRRGCSWSSGTAGSRPRCPTLGSAGWATAARTDPTTCDVLVATRHSAAAYKPVPPGDGRRAAHRRRVPRPRRRDPAAGDAPASTRNGSGSPRRSNAATTRSPSCCCRTSAASATATASSRPSPTACARRPRVAFVGVALSVDERAEYAAIEQRLVSARQHLRAGARHAARAVRRLPRRGRAPRRARRRRRRPRRARLPRRVLQAAPDRGADRSASTSCSAASRPRSRTPTARWCSPRPCAPRTTRSTGSIRWCRST